MEYEFHELLGRGGFGEVYRGTARGAHGARRPVAIKRVLRRLAREPRFLAGLVREAKLAMPLSHGNIVGVLDLVESDEDVFVVLDYVDGPNLYELSRTGAEDDRPVFDLGLACYVVEQVAQGLAYAHERPDGAVVHLDLSPNNILVSRAGEVKVTDFGIARQLGTPGRTGRVEGKWFYMSPEQVRGERLSPQSDVFSLGVVLFELITGRKPFPGTTPAQVAARIQSGTAPRVAALRSEVPPALDRVVAEALAADRAARFPSMAAFLKALRRVRFEAGWDVGAAELAARVAARTSVADGAGAVATVTAPRPEPAGGLAALGLLPGPRRRTAVAVPETPEGADLTQVSPRALDAAEDPADPSLSGAVVPTRVLERSPVAEAEPTVLTASGPARIDSVDPDRRPAVEPRLRRPVALAVVVSVGLGVGLAVAHRLVREGGPPVERVGSAEAEPRSGATATMELGSASEDAHGPAPIAEGAAPIAEEAGGSPAVPSRTADARPPGRPRPRPTPTGTLKLASTPWAEVTVDGRPTGRTTPVVLELPAGHHRVLLTNPAADLRREIEVTIRAGATEVVPVRLDPR